MKKQLERMIQVALRRLLDQEELVAMPAYIQIEASKDKEFGDFATNIALILARTTHHAPYTVAERIVNALDHSPLVEKIEIRKPGFINFFLTPCAYQNLLADILSLKNEYGKCKIGRAKKVLVEFVSASPVKSLCQNHARLAVFGKAVARLLNTIGFQVSTEFYIDDVGFSAELFIIEVWRNYLALLEGQDINRSDNSAYAEEIAFLLRSEMGDQFYVPNIVPALLLLNDNSTADIILYAKSQLGEKFSTLERDVISIVTKQQRADLDAFDISFDYWTDAKALFNKEVLQDLLNRLDAKGVLYQQEGGCWFKAQQFGDERDRVLVRPNGEYTHLAYDLAYHLNKFERGFDLAIDIFDFNPIDYAAGIQAGMQALGYDPEQLMAFCVQPVHIIRQGECLRIPLRAMQSICSKDSLYFQLLIRRACQPIDFDFDVLSEDEHPLTAIQYAVTRIQTIFKEMKARGLTFSESDGIAAIDHLMLEEERVLLNTLALYSETVIHAALQYEPHHVVHYLRTLAAEFHTYYNVHPFSVDDLVLRGARLALVASIRQVLINGCALLGVSVRDTM